MPGREWDSRSPVGSDRVILSHRGARPRIDGTAWIAPTAVVCGDVTVGPGACLLFGAVATAEGGPVEIGECAIVMENAVVRGVPGHACRIGSHVLIGPGAHISGCRVGDRAFLATGVTVLNGAVLGEGADVRIGAVVHVRTRLEPGATVPIGWVAVGDPARVLPPGDHDAIWEVQRRLGFRDAAFQMGDLPRDRFMLEMTTRYTRALSSHAEDREISRFP